MDPRLAVMMETARAYRDRIMDLEIQSELMKNDLESLELSIKNYNGK